MLVGISAADITPPIGTPLQGHFSLHPEARGVLAPLEIRTIVFAPSPGTPGEGGGEGKELGTRDNGGCPHPNPLPEYQARGQGSGPIVIITADLIGVSLDLTRRVREAIWQRYAIPAEHVLIAASHTHCGPAMLPCIGLVPIPEIVTDIEAKMVASVGDALEELEPVRLGVGAAGAHFNVNRRPLPGTTEMFSNSAGVVDKRVRILRVDKMDGTPLAILFHYSCHPTAKNGSDGLVSPDYPGVARRLIEKELGCRAAFLPGCFGDIRPNLVDENNRFVSANAEQLAEMGRELGEAVVGAAKYTRTFEEERLGAAEAECFFPFGKRSATDQLEEMAKKLEQPLRADWARRQLRLSPWPGTPACVERSRKGEGRGEGIGANGTTNEMENYRQECPHPNPLPEYRARGQEGASGEASIMQAVRIGPIALVGIPGEPVQEIGYEIEGEAAGNFEDVWPVGYANDQIGYFCTPRMYEEGGYEPTAYVVYDRPAPFAGEQKLICDEAAELLRRLAK